MIIGIPKEIMHDEARVAATPDSVKKYVADGHKVLVEKGAGVGASHADAAYAAAGAVMCDTAQQVYDEAELILKVKEPLFNEETGKHEVDMMHAGQYLITFIHPAAPVNHKMVKHMAEAGIISMAIEGVPRISRAQSMDALTSMSTCAGYKGILMAASDLIKFIPMMPTAAGMIKPCCRPAGTGYRQAPGRIDICDRYSSRSCRAGYFSGRKAGGIRCGSCTGHRQGRLRYGTACGCTGSRA